VLPDLVPAEDIVGAISLGSAQWNLGRVVGPALAGLVIVVGSFSAAFAVNAISFAAVIVSFLFVRLPPPLRTDDDAGILAHMRDGVRVVRNTPALRAAIGMIALAAGFTAPFIALVPAVAARLVDAGGDAKAIAGATGVLVTAQGVGAVAAALIFPSLVASFGRRRMLLVVLFLTPLALVPYALAPSVPLAAAAIVVVGGAYICILSGLSAVVQLRAPAAYRGRILSLYFATLSVVFPLGALVQGALARRVGLRATTIGGALGFLAALAAIAVLRPSVLAALDSGDAEEPPVVADAATATAT
jgi:predicted MFS family arabinose efflux permease